MNRTTLSGFGLLTMLLALSACGGGGGGAGTGGGTTTFTIGGNVTGLDTSTSMVVQLTTAAGANGLAVYDNGAYTFPGSFADGTAYTVDMTAQPTGQTCTVANPAGTVSGGNITNADVDCVAATYTVGGSVSGLAAGKSVVLQNNAANDLTLSANGSFSFTTPVAHGGAYAVTVLTQPQPSGQTCVVTSGSGTVSGANVTNVAVSCSPWTRQFGTVSSDFAKAVTTDAAGNIFVAGDTSDDIDGGGADTHAGGSDLFLAKYAANGNLLWIRQFGTTGHEFVYGVATDSAGNTYVAGTTTDDLDGAGSGVYGGGGADAFVVKYDAGGALVWIRQLGDIGYEEARGVAVDSSDNVYITGFTTGDIDGAGSQTFAGVNDVILAKYNASGTLQWVRQFGTADEDRAYGIAASGSTIYLTGYAKEYLGDMGSYGGYLDVFLAAYNTSGTRLWVNQIGPPAMNVGLQPAVDGSGNIYVTGYTGADLDGVGSGTHAGGYDMFVARFNSSGALTRVTQIGTTGNEFGAGIAVDTAGNAYVAGYIWRDSAAGDYGDLRTIRINVDGTVAWTGSLGTPYTDGGYGLGIALHGNDVYVAGQTGGDLDGNTNVGGVGGDDAFVVKYDTSGNKQ